MPYNHEDWQRILCEEHPIYVHRHNADWFIPNAKADALLQSNGAENRFFARLPEPNPLHYVPKVYDNKHLREFWIHLTNRCNLTCTHCLFSSSPKEKDTLTLSTVLPHIKEAYEKGCRLFVLSGGEPFVHPQIVEIIHEILLLKESEVAILTNGMLLEKILTCKDLPKERVHFQISLDGLPDAHDAIRGEGSFAKLEANLKWLNTQGYRFSLSLCLHPLNVQTLPQLILLVAQLGATHLHFLWYFAIGNGVKEDMLETDILFAALIEAQRIAQGHGVVIDNFEALKTQIFAPKGTVHDGSSSGRDSLALGYDGLFYPSAALVGISEVCLEGNTIGEALQSEVAQAIQKSSVVELSSPLRFLLGGGDLDHSFIHKQTFMGDDPYAPLLEKLALWMMLEAAQASRVDEAALCLEMGDILYSCGASDGVAHTHANCLIATGENASLKLVKSFYHDAALEDNEAILNPVCYAEEHLSHIPQHLRFRGYGCGSPILDAALQKKERVLDLGSGRGIECFIASKMVGEEGVVKGIDMLDSMLSLSCEGALEVAKNLGYNNLSFEKAYLEELPCENESYDVITSNCVLNLSSHKRKLFAQIYRVLKNGGRLVVSDVVCDEEAGAKIRNSQKLSGECIAGALTQRHLLGLLSEAGFQSVSLLKKLPYREVEGHSFYSLTFVAHKRSNASFVVDDTQMRTTLEGEDCCACFTPLKQTHNCMVCGEGLVYGNTDKEEKCHYCGLLKHSSVTCKKGHFVCDECHSKEALAVIEHVCASSKETDMLKLFYQIREHPAILKHGPEHHSMVPAIIITTYRNLGGTLGADALKTALNRGSHIPGGACGFLGICGAAAGVGIAFAIILESSPMKAKARASAQKVTHAVLGKIAEYEAARCCNREVWSALTIAAALSDSFLHVKLLAEQKVKCDQKKFNQQCYGRQCPIF